MCAPWWPRTDPASANAAILADLEGGATSIWVTLGGSATSLDDLPAALAGVIPDIAPIALRPADDVSELAAAQAFSSWCRDLGIRPHPTSSLGADPIGRAVRSGSAATPDFDLAGIAALAADLGVRAIVVDGSVAHEAGAGDAAEIGYVLAAGAAYLRQLAAAGYPPDVGCAMLEARFAVTADQFASVAKLRAARLTWHRLTELCGVPEPARGQRQHAVTSRAMFTRYDPWVNLLRTTVAAFAAGVGGAESVTVLPFDAALGIPDAFGRRMARNISALLDARVARREGRRSRGRGVRGRDADHRDRRRRPGRSSSGSKQPAGSWRRSPTARGASGSTATAAERRRRIASRRQPITGVSEFPLAGEVLPARSGVPLTDGVDRWAAPFEELRDSGAPADAVVLVTVGSVADASARTLFVENLLAAGGIPYRRPSPGATRHVAPPRSWSGSDTAYAAGAAEAIAGTAGGGRPEGVPRGAPVGCAAGPGGRSRRGG